MTEIEFDARTTSRQFQERLRAAQQSTTQRQLEQGFETRDSSIDGLSLEEQRNKLRDQVLDLESNVEKLRNELATHRKRREREASVVKMTPEKRAQLQDEEVHDEPIDLDVIFDYLVRIGSAPLPSNAADLSAGDFVQPHAELRERVMQDPEIQAQVEFAHIEFTKTSNEIKTLPDGSGTVRHCELAGSAYDQQFSLSFKVRDDRLSVEDFQFEVDIEMQLALGLLLERIKDGCNILAFFRLLVHFGHLVNERRTMFQRLQHIFSSKISVEEIGDERLKFSSNREGDPEITLSWQTKVSIQDGTDVAICICEQVIPDIQMEVYTGVSEMSAEKEEVCNRIPEGFSRLMSAKGPLIAARVMLDAVFKLDHQ